MYLKPGDRLRVRVSPEPIWPDHYIAPYQLGWGTILLFGVKSLRGLFNSFNCVITCTIQIP